MDRQKVILSDIDKIRYAARSNPGEGPDRIEEWYTPRVVAQGARQATDREKKGGGLKHSSSTEKIAQIPKEALSNRRSDELGGRCPGDRASSIVLLGDGRQDGGDAEQIREGHSVCSVEGEDGTYQLSAFEVSGRLSMHDGRSNDQMSRILKMDECPHAPDL